jgi:hypothetical protein
MLTIYKENKFYTKTVFMLLFYFVTLLKVPANCKTTACKIKTLQATGNTGLGEPELLKNGN